MAVAGLLTVFRKILLPAMFLTNNDTLAFRRASETARLARDVFHHDVSKQFDAAVYAGDPEALAYREEAERDSVLTLVRRAEWVQYLELYPERASGSQPRPWRDE